MDLKIHFLLINLVLYVVSSVRGQNDENSVCKKHKESTSNWSCMLTKSCQYAQLLQFNKEIIKCGYEKICCPQLRTSSKSTNKIFSTEIKSTTPTILTTTQTTTTTSVKHSAKLVWGKCQEYSQARYVKVEYDDFLIGAETKHKLELDCIHKTEILISGGTRAEPKEFPHMALIGFGENVNRILWNCGGCLISERFILSAAHCSQLGNLGNAKWALLGELQRNPQIDNTKRPGLFCIVTHFVHPGYNPSYIDNDIVLFKLQYPITFSSSIRPICLFTSDGIPSTLRNQSIVTGWGTTAADEDVSEVLLKAIIHFQPESDCISAYRGDSRLKNGFDPKTMICAGDKYDRKDTCSGDSGGPLQVSIPDYLCMWNQVGITSYGPTFCGSRRKPVPAIYTRVANYIEWIQRIVWP